jgi:hypothetical protein
MRVHDVESVMIEEMLDRAYAAQKRKGILRSCDQRMREIEVSDLRLQLVAADVRVVRIDARGAQGLDLRERRCGSSRPAVSGGEVEDFHSVFGANSTLL